MQSHGQPVLNFLLVLLILDLYFLARIKIFNSEAEGLRIRLSEVIAFLFLFFYDGVEWFIKIILVFLVDVESIVIFWRDLYLVLHWLLVLIVGLVAFRQRGSLLFGLFVWGLHSYDYMNIYMFIGGLQDAYINLKWSITIGDCRIIFWLGIAAAPFCFLSRFSESRNTLPFCFCLCFCFLRLWMYPGDRLLTGSYFFWLGLAVVVNLWGWFTYTSDLFMNWVIVFFFRWRFWWCWWKFSEVIFSIWGENDTVIWYFFVVC